MINNQKSMINNQTATVESSIMYRAGHRRFVPSTGENEFIPYEQLIKPNPDASATSASFVALGKRGLISHLELNAQGINDEQIKRWVNDKVLRRVKAKA